MSKDDESRRARLLGQTVPGYSALTEAFGAAIDGASQLTRTRAKQLAERLLTQAGLDNVDLGEAASEAGTRINQLAEELIAARKANRALLQRTVTTELEKSLARLGLARADEIAALRAEVAELRHDLDLLTVNGPAAPAPAKKAPGKKAAAKKAPAKKAPAKKAAAPTPAAKTPAGRTASKQAATKQTATKQTATKQTRARKSAARKSTEADA